MWMPRIRDLPPGEICSVPSPGEIPHPEPCWNEGSGRQEGEVGELLQGWSQNVILALFSSSYAVRTLIITMVALEPSSLFT